MPPIVRRSLRNPGPGAAQGVWIAQARARAPDFVSFPLPTFAKSLVHKCGPPPPQYASQFKLVAEYTARGYVPHIVCGYAPR